jgi:hypothetical protein
VALNLNALWPSIRGLVYFGWVVALIRFVLDIAMPDQAMWFGVYYMMPLGYLYYGITGKMDDLSAGRLTLAMLMTAFFVWLIPNTITYTAAQFIGLEQGRFAPDRGVIAPVESVLGKLGRGALTGFTTWIFGALWSALFGLLLIYLPGRIRRAKARTV